MEQERTNRNCPLWGTETCARLNMRACRGCPAEDKDPRECNEIREDGTSVGKEIAGEWKCPYHNGRMCLRLIASALPDNL